MEENKDILIEKKSSRLKLVIVILIILLLISGACLAGRVLYLRFFADQKVTAVVPDNLIGEESDDDSDKEDTDTEGENDTTSTESEESTNQSGAQSSTPKAATLTLYRTKPSDNEKFEVRNMLPGDVEVKYFCVKASHEKDIVLTFSAEITEETKNLGEILHIKVTHLDTQKVLYDGVFRDMDLNGYEETLLGNSKKETTAYYEIEVSLPTSAGNEYQAAMLKADFKWFVKDADSLSNPLTGDDTNAVSWIIILCAALAMAGAMLLWRRKKDEEEKDERENR